MLGSVQKLTKAYHGKIQMMPNLINFILQHCLSQGISHGAEKTQHLFVHFPSSFLDRTYIMYLMKTLLQTPVVELRTIVIYLLTFLDQI